jgi:hypothetical protein
VAPTLRWTQLLKSDFQEEKFDDNEKEVNVLTEFIKKLKMCKSTTFASKYTSLSIKFTTLLA